MWRVERGSRWSHTVGRARSPACGWRGLRVIRQRAAYRRPRGGQEGVGGAPGGGGLYIAWHPGWPPCPLAPGRCVVQKVHKVVLCCVVPPPIPHGGDLPRTECHERPVCDLRAFGCRTRCRLSATGLCAQHEVTWRRVSLVSVAHGKAPETPGLPNAAQRRTATRVGHSQGAGPCRAMHCMQQVPTEFWWSERK